MHNWCFEVAECRDHHEQESSGRCANRVFDAKFRSKVAFDGWLPQEAKEASNIISSGRIQIDATQVKKAKGKRQKTREDVVIWNAKTVVDHLKGYKWHAPSY